MGIRIMKSFGMRRLGLILICLQGLTWGLPKRPSRPKGLTTEIDQENDESFFEDLQDPKERENEEEIDFGSFSWYGDSEDESIEDEPIEILEAESRKRPQRPSSNKRPTFNFGSFDDPLDFLPNFEPSNKVPIIIERTQEENEEENDNTDENGLETMPFEIVERNRNDDYEVREYGASKWVCTD